MPKQHKKPGRRRRKYLKRRRKEKAKRWYHQHPINPLGQVRYRKAKRRR